MQPPVPEEQNITRQCKMILELLRKTPGEWVPLPKILDLGVAQYNARVWDLRKKGFVIENRTKVEQVLDQGFAPGDPNATTHDVRHSWFRLLETANTNL